MYISYYVWIPGPICLRIQLTRQPHHQQRTQNKTSRFTFQKSYSFFRFLSKTVSSYLPTQVTDVFSQGRAFASVTLPEAGIRRMCAIAKIQKQLR